MSFLDSYVEEVSVSLVIRECNICNISNILRDHLIFFNQNTKREDDSNKYYIFIVILIG